MANEKLINEILDAPFDISPQTLKSLLGTPKVLEALSTQALIILGLEKTDASSRKAIEKAYKKRALSLHPDKNKDNAKRAEAAFKKVSAAKDFLIFLIEKNVNSQNKKFDFVQIFKDFQEYLPAKMALVGQIDLLKLRSKTLGEILQLVKKNCKKLPKNHPLKQNLCILRIFTNNLNLLISRIDAYSNSLKSVDAIRECTQNLEKFNTALEKTCSTSFKYELATTVIDFYPKAYALFILYGPLDIALAILLPLALQGIVPIPVSLLIDLIKIAIPVSVLLPAIHGISTLVRNNVNPINFNTENLPALATESNVIDEKFMQSALQKDKEKFSYASYQPIFSTVPTSPETNADTKNTFLSEQEASEIKKAYSAG